MLIFLKIPICQMVVNNSLGYFAFFLNTFAAEY